MFFAPHPHSPLSFSSSSTVEGACEPPAAQSRPSCRLTMASTVSPPWRSRLPSPTTLPQRPPWEHTLARYLRLRARAPRARLLAPSWRRGAALAPARAPGARARSLPHPGSLLPPLGPSNLTSASLLLLRLQCDGKLHLQISAPAPRCCRVETTRGSATVWQGDGRLLERFRQAVRV